MIVRACVQTDGLVTIAKVSLLNAAIVALESITFIYNSIGGPLSLMQNDMQV